MIHKISNTHSSNIAFISGSVQVLVIDAFNEEQFINADDIEWQLMRYGESFCIHSKKIKDIKFHDKALIIILEPTCTQNLYGKFLHRIIVNHNNHVHIFNLGTISIKLPIKEPTGIVAFPYGTDEQICKMLEAHYNNQIDITDYWNIGDTRVIYLSPMDAEPGSSIKHVGQYMAITIIGVNHDYLRTPINGHDKAVITVQCREVLGNNGNAENDYYWGKVHMSTDSDNYSDTPLRIWLNNTFLNSLPEIYSTHVKAVIKPNFKTHTDGNMEIIHTYDKAFLLSVPEVCGDITNNYYKAGIETKGSEGTQYEYYLNNNKRVKYANNDGNKGKKASWMLRSPSSEEDFENGIDYHYCGIFMNGTITSFYGGAKLGISPAFSL